jgi:hypothetical protein
MLCPPWSDDSDLVAEAMDAEAELIAQAARALGLSVRAGDEIWGARSADGCGS